MFMLPHLEKKMGRWGEEKKEMENEEKMEKMGARNAEEK